MSNIPTEVPDPQAAIKEVMEKFLDVIGVDKKLAKGQIKFIDPSLNPHLPYQSAPDSRVAEFVHINIPDPTRHEHWMRHVAAMDRTQGGLSIVGSVSRTQLGKREDEPQPEESVRADVAARLFNLILSDKEKSFRGEKPDGSRMVWVKHAALPEFKEKLAALDKAEADRGRPLQGALVFASGIQRALAARFSPRDVKVRIESLEPNERNNQLQLLITLGRGQENLSVIAEALKEAGVEVKDKLSPTIDIVLEVPPVEERENILKRFAAKMEGQEYKSKESQGSVKVKRSHLPDKIEDPPLSR